MPETSQSLKSLFIIWNIFPKIFGNFIKKFYPSMYLKDLDQLLTLDFSNTELSPEQKNFCQEFSYDPTENPSETIEKLFKY